MKNRLEGKVVTKLAVRADKEALCFTIADEPPVVVFVMGDCCSRSWVESIEGLDRLIGATILTVEDAYYAIPYATIDTFTDDVVKSYALKIITTRGHVVIDYRNSSNGYYGASLAWPDDDQPNDALLDPRDIWVEVKEGICNV